MRAMSVTTAVIGKLLPVLLVLRVCTVVCYPTGPPTSVCSSQLPNHPGTAKTSGSPYSISVSTTTYTPGSTIQVTISGGTFKGFFIQARRQDSNYGSTTEAIGQFGTAPSDTQRLSCSPGSNNGWAHSNPDDKTSKTITWTAPNTDEGPIRFRSPVVQVETNYWAPDATTSNQITYSGPAAPSWNDWNEWGSCSVTCGGGTQTRTRTCNDPDTGDSTTCSGSNVESRDCNTQSCPVPTWENWNSWGTCSVTCGGGTQTRTRTCNDPDTGDSTSCSGSDEESRDCNTASCPTDEGGEDPEWNNWSSWGTCSVPCGGGTQTRIRTCDDPDTGDSTTCSGSDEESGNCNTQTCPTDGEPTWNTWSSYSTCSHTCGTGTQSRTRSCNDPDTTDGIVCTGEGTQTALCNTQSCPGGGDPAWGSWSPYTSCTVTCGSGTQTRSRICNDPDAADGRSCAGSGTETSSCNSQSCPEATWNSWGPYTGCTRSCGTGTRSRTRTCNDPDNTDNQGCIGSATESSTCNTQPCPADVGTWTTWSEWSGCSATCDTGIRSRTRSCTPSVTSCEGQGDTIQSQSCFAQPCEAGGSEWNEWSRWSACSVSCDDGQRQRTRTCYNPDPSQSDRCYGDVVETERCNERCCDCGTVSLETLIWIVVGIIVGAGVLGVVVALLCIFARAGSPNNATVIQPAGFRPQAPSFVPRRPQTYYY